MFHIWVILQPRAICLRGWFLLTKNSNIRHLYCYMANMPKVEEIFMHVWIFMNLSLQNWQKQFISWCWANKDWDLTLLQLQKNLFHTLCTWLKVLQVSPQVPFYSSHIITSSTLDFRMVSTQHHLLGCWDYFIKCTLLQTRHWGNQTEWCKG